MKTLLYATDCSPNAIPALLYAYHISKTMKARLVVTYVFQHPELLGLQGGNELAPMSEEKALEHYYERLENFCSEHLGPQWRSRNILIEPISGKSVVKGIISKAMDWRAYFIVVGITGDNPLRDFIVGSTTKLLINKAPCPVLAIPSEIGYETLQTIVYASDFEDGDVYAIRRLAEMAEPFGAKIIVVHVSRDVAHVGDNRMNLLKERIQKKVSYPNISYKLIFSDKVFETLQHTLGDLKANLVVMLERDKGGWAEQWLHRDLVKRMETKTEIPLLSFREGNHQLSYVKATL
ncbi:universal stress protein [Arenibacter aquaticus]|nr:universal stress protein [Arenibacter aquaticus]